jgi:hypothetical protein
MAQAINPYDRVMYASGYEPATTKEAAAATKPRRAPAKPARSSRNTGRSKATSK